MPEVIFCDCHIRHHPFLSNTCLTFPFCPPELWRLMWGDLRLVVPEPACQSLTKDRWHVEINSLAQHHPFCEQMNLLWQCVYERLGDLLSSHLNILPFSPQAHCYLCQWGPTLLCALMFNSRTHNQAGRRAWVCWELTSAQELWFPINIPCVVHTGLCLCDCRVVTPLRP